MTPPRKTKSGKPTKGKSPRKNQEEPESQVLNGIIVVLDGTTINLKHSGSVTPLEMPTLLRKAAEVAEELLGIKR